MAHGTNTRHQISLGVVARLVVFRVHSLMVTSWHGKAFRIKCKSKIQDSRSFYCLKYKHHKQHGSNTIMYIRQREVETISGSFTTRGKNSCSCTHVDQWKQKGLVVHRKMIFPPYETYDENAGFFCSATIMSIQLFSLKEVEQGHLKMAAPEKIVNVVSSLV